jgi:hypothetical protein
MNEMQELLTDQEIISKILIEENNCEYTVYLRTNISKGNYSKRC